MPSGRRLCDTHTGLFDGTSHPGRSDVRRFAPGLGSWSLDPTHPCLTKTPTTPERPCNIAFASPSLTRTRSAPCAAVCPCAENRNRRHNAVDHIFYEAAQEAGLRPQKEKADLLQPRPDSDDFPQRASHDRPADARISDFADQLQAHFYEDKSLSKVGAPRTVSLTASSVDGDARCFMWKRAWWPVTKHTGSTPLALH